MKAKSGLMFVLLASLLAPALRMAAQDDDKETAAAMKKAAEAAKGMGLPMPDVKKMLDDDAKKEAKQKKKQVEAALAAGPLALPAWTPAVPQFKADGPVAIKKVRDEDKIAQTGTSPQTPAQIADAWDAAKGQGWSRSRSTNNINGRITIFVHLYTNSSPREDVELIAERGPEEKITKVTISKPLPEVPDDDDDD
jgi:hypothetical protein